jgi:hypothetical protein
MRLFFYFKLPRMVSLYYIIQEGGQVVKYLKEFYQNSRKTLDEGRNFVV